MSTETTPIPDVPDRLETVRMDALSDAAKNGARGSLEMHRAIANRLLREGAPARAFSELVRATREVPMNARLAAALAHIALRAGTLPAAVTLLSSGIDEVEGTERAGVRHALARLYRRSDDLELAREQLVVLLAENPTDRRARLTLNALLEREERWDELDASLEKETREELRRGTLRRASRTALRRARLWGERLANPARAALRYGQAAQFAEQGKDFESAFLLRLLWLRALHKSQAPERAMTEAVEAAMRAGERVGKADRVRHMVAELRTAGAPVPSLTDVAVAIVTEGSEPTAAAGRAYQPVPPPRRSSTQIELMAVAAEAERQGKKPEVAALLHAAIEEGPDPQALKRLEAHYVSRSAWRELAQFYRDCAQSAKSNAEKAQWKEKLGELLESELDDPIGAARAWAEVVELTGDQRAVKEQVRLHSERKDAKGVRRALDEGVTRAVAPQVRADALVARAEEALTRKDVRAATSDLEAALTAVPQHPTALAGLAELALAEGDSHFIPMLRLALERVPRRKAGRGELFRRLGRLADAGIKDTKVAQHAWAEVLVELPEDEEAQGRLSVLAREGGDAANLEAALRAQLTKEPRGPKARLARIELIAMLERTDRGDDALAELRMAVRYEPGHQEAWLALADRLEQRSIWPECAWALEHAATATSDGAQRIQLWLRLARFTSDRLGDEEKAETYEKRADKLKRELLEEQAELPAGPMAGPLTVPPPKGARPPPRPETTPADGDFEKLAELLRAVAEPEPTPLPRPSPHGRGGVPAEAIAMLRKLANPLGSNVEIRSSPKPAPVSAKPPPPVPDEREAAVPWGDEPTNTHPPPAASSPAAEARSLLRGEPARAPAAPAPAKASSSGGGVSVPAELRVKSSGAGVPVPADVKTPGRQEIKSNPRGVAMPTAEELRREVKSSGMGISVPADVRPPRPSEARVEVKSAGRGVAMPTAEELRNEVKSRGMGIAVPAELRQPRPSEARVELKSAGRGVAMPTAEELRNEVKSQGMGISVPPELRQPRPSEARVEVKSAGRGVAMPTAEELRNEVKSRGLGISVPPELRAQKPGPPVPGLDAKPELKGFGKGMPVSKSTPGVRIPAVEPRQTPAVALKPRSSAPDSAKSEQVTPPPPPPAAVLQETRNLRVPLVPVPPDEGDEEEWEGSTVGKFDDDDDDVSVEEAMSGSDDLIEMHTSDLEPPSDEWEAPPGVVSGEEEEPVAPLQTQELPAQELGDPGTPLPPSFGPSPSKLLSKEREQLFERVRGAPLEADGYKLLAEHFDAAGDASRSSLMLEIALAIEGDPHAAPRAPKLILSATDRAGLKHPVLRGEEGELLGLCGTALCRIYPTRGGEAGSRDEFRLDLGKGARGAADALLTAVRILGLRAPDVYPSNDNGPPFALVFPGKPRLLVGRLAIKRVLPEAELRFFAGRALFTQNADLLALRNLRREQLIRALQVLGQVLRGQSLSAEARAVRDGLPPKGWERLKQLYERVARKLNLPVLAEGARHSANRAGLVVCGGVAPALAALRAKKALPSEMVELVRFAASERYLVLRSRKLGK